MKKLEMYRYVKEIFLYLRFIWCVWLWPRTSFHYSKRSHHKLVRPHSDVGKKSRIRTARSSLTELQCCGAGAAWSRRFKGGAGADFLLAGAAQKSGGSAILQKNCMLLFSENGWVQPITWQYVDGKIFCNLNNGALNIKDDVIVIETVYARDDGIVIYLGEGICLCWGKGRG